MDIHDKLIRSMCGEANNDVSYSSDSVSFKPSYGCCNADDYVDSLKYRNEIEAFSRLKGIPIPDLYNTEVNNKVTAALSTVYHDDCDEPDLSLDNPGNRFNDLVVKYEGPTVDEVINESSHLSWDAYFMNVAILTSKRSSDANTQVGAVLVLDNKIIGTGYNGIPKGLDKSLFPTGRDGELHESKYGYVVHAEANTLCNTTVFDLKGSKLYCTLYPCNECAKLLIQKGISEIIYLSDKHHDDPPYIASRKLFSAAGIKVRQYRDKILL